jgi:hypothetical protein
MLSTALQGEDSKAGNDHIFSESIASTLPLRDADGWTHGASGSLLG